tara:strand:+ start:162 stop:338 length:177 start_codon:yes stop_codon:yes gene_type:complete
MEELEIISKDKNKETILNLSIEELKEYKDELLRMIKSIDDEISKRKSEREKAESVFKK